MIPVNQAQVEAALERTLVAPAEVDKLPRRAQKASELVEGYLGVEYDPADTEHPIPSVVTSVVADVTARLYSTDDSDVPQFVDSKTQSMGPLGATVRYNTEATGRQPWLTKADKTRLRTVFSGMRVMSMGTNRCPRS